MYHIESFSPESIFMSSTKVLFIVLYVKYIGTTARYKGNRSAV